MKIGVCLFAILLASTTNVLAAPSDVLKVIKKADPPPAHTINVELKTIRKNNPIVERQFGPKNNISTNSIPTEYQAKKFRYTSHQPPTRVLEEKNWKTTEINQVIEHPYTIRKAKHKYNNYSPATAYFRKDGHYVVIDNRDRRLVHLSDTSKPIGNDGTNKYWKTDTEIIEDPYIPKGAPGYQ